MLVLIALGALGACGGAEDSEPAPEPEGAFAGALASVGGGGVGASLGVGWVAESELSALPAPDRERLERALGPNATTIVVAAPALRRRYGFAPRRAGELVSVGGSYAYGLRLDGIGGAGLVRALLDAGGRASFADEARLVDVGGYAVVPAPLLELGVNGLGARDAFARDRVVLAISDRARDALLGRGGRLLEQPAYIAAASCLGEVVAARLVPAKLLHSTELGTDLIAAGVRADASEGEGSELICLLGGDPEAADRLADSLAHSLSEDAALASADVERLELGGTEVVRAELELRRRARAGFVFDALAGGDLAAVLERPAEPGAVSPSD